jgi:ribosomal protein L44E
MKRNPRRAYNKDGSEIQPATVASHLTLGRRKIEIFCNDCRHYGNGFDVSDLPPETPIPDVCLRYRCSVCGSKNLISRGDTHEHYALIDAARKGKS